MSAYTCRFRKAFRHDRSIHVDKKRSLRRTGTKMACEARVFAAEQLVGAGCSFTGQPALLKANERSQWLIFYGTFDV